MMAGLSILVRFEIQKARNKFILNNELAQWVEPSMKCNVSFDVSFSITNKLYDHLFETFWNSDIIPIFVYD